MLKSVYFALFHSYLIYSIFIWRRAYILRSGYGITHWSYISKLIAKYQLAWHSWNEAVSLSLMCRCPDCATDKFQGCHANGCGFASHVHAFVFTI